jgi:hypothetical protein
MVNTKTLSQYIMTRLFSTWVLKHIAKGHLALYMRNRKDSFYFQAMKVVWLTFWKQIFHSLHTQMCTISLIKTIRPQILGSCQRQNNTTQCYHYNQTKCLYFRWIAWPLFLNTIQQGTWFIQEIGIQPKMFFICIL